jgi:N-alpha-acetyl-L-2,4-diaminobutyrate deacetylase
MSLAGTGTGPALPPPSVSCSIDLDAAGARHGFLSVPHSSDESAWGAVLAPIAVIRGGDGPTVLVTGGNHGDEFEGPLAIRKLVAGLDPARLTGRVILLPALNPPAQMAGRRTSPIDGGNMNRSFPGRPNGTVTERIADYVTRVLIPRADLVLDIHSGGRTLEFLPYAACHELPHDPELQAASLAAVLAFDAPYALTMLELDALGMLDTAVELVGRRMVTTEIGGGGAVTPETLAIAERGVMNVLAHAGVLQGHEAPPPASRRMRQPDGRCFLIAETDGLVEPLLPLGADIRSGDAVLRIWPHGRTDARPVVMEAAMDGLLIGRRFPTLCRPGDCLAVLAEDA